VVVVIVGVGVCGSLRPALSEGSAGVTAAAAAAEEVEGAEGRTGERQLLEEPVGGWVGVVVGLFVGGVGAGRGGMLPLGEIGPAAVSSEEVMGACLALARESAKEAGGGPEGRSGGKSVV